MHHADWHYISNEIVVLGRYLNEIPVVFVHKANSLRITSLYSTSLTDKFLSMNCDRLPSVPHVSNNLIKFPIPLTYAFTHRNRG